MFLREVVRLYGTGSPHFPDERLEVKVYLHPPNRRKFDVDNRLKPLLDALETANLYKNDNQIDKLTVIRGDVVPEGECIVVVQPTVQ